MGGHGFPTPDRVRKPGIGKRLRVPRSVGPVVGGGPRPPRRPFPMVRALLLVLILALPAWGWEITIAFTNDLHAYADRLSALGPILAQADLVLDAGDTWEDTYRATGAAEAWRTLQVMVHVGYHAMVLGNHDTYLGPRLLAELVSAAPFPVLATNLRSPLPTQRWVLCEVQGCGCSSSGSCWIWRWSGRGGSSGTPWRASGKPSPRRQPTTSSSSATTTASWKNRPGSSVARRPPRALCPRAVALERNREPRRRDVKRQPLPAQGDLVGVPAGIERPQG
ncbi:MAG TPA: hypothetical protein ENN53_04830, partial [Candidatus Acetothermia bacterium]|nr:hypothetical protein [Candidatus Acetothermia bacterium]